VWALPDSAASANAGSTVCLRKIIRKARLLHKFAWGFDWENSAMNRAMILPVAMLGLTFAFGFGRRVPAATPIDRLVLAQAMVPPTGMMDAQHPMPMNERYGKRFPQPARVGDLIGLPVLDLNSTTLGYVQQVVRNSAGSIEFIVSFSRWWGWFGRTVAVPLEALGIEGRQLVSLDMPPSEYAAAPTWHDMAVEVLPADATIHVALART
jgi:hypothetical protein